ncbi:MAG TPA: hypothetical protein VGN97_00110 [Mesorhizobium sp.]|jgi:NADPH-dependent curcumin reductase CurA|nr:hypothetical protein [Mesorhizobium sp.]
MTVSPSAFVSDSYWPDFIADLSEWLRNKRIAYREGVTEGLENAPAMLVGLLSGSNVGKA